MCVSVCGGKVKAQLCEAFILPVGVCVDMSIEFGLKPFSFVLFRFKNIF